MTYIPNCREDDDYNEKYLNKEDKEFIKGFDYAVEDALDSFFANYDDYDYEIDGEDIDLCRIFTNHYEILEKLKENILQHMESERDEMITSMIDNMDDNEYDANRAKYKED